MYSRWFSTVSPYTITIKLFLHVWLIWMTYISKAAETKAENVTFGFTNKHTDSSAIRPELGYLAVHFSSLLLEEVQKHPSSVLTNFQMLKLSMRHQIHNIDCLRGKANSMVLSPVTLLLTKQDREQDDWSVVGFEVGCAEVQKGSAPQEVPTDGASYTSENAKVIQTRDWDMIHLTQGYGRVCGSSCRRPRQLSVQNSSYFFLFPILCINWECKGYNDFMTKHFEWLVHEPWFMNFGFWRHWRVHWHTVLYIFAFEIWILDKVLVYAGNW